MARLKIELPEKHFFSTVLTVRITEINYGNHAGNDAIVGMLHEARMRWLHHYGYTELNIEGTGMIMSSLCIEFKNESFYGDKLTIQLFADNITARSFDLYYVIIRSDKIIAKATSEMICFNYKDRKIAQMPEALFKILTV